MDSAIFSLGPLKIVFFVPIDAGTITGTVGETGIYGRSNVSTGLVAFGSFSYGAGNSFFGSRLSVADGDFTAFTMNTAAPLTINWTIQFTFSSRRIDFLMSETGRRREFISTSLGFQFSESVSRYAEEEVSFPRSFTDLQAGRAEAATQQFSAHTETTLGRTETATEQFSARTDQAGTRTETQQIINT